MKKILILTLTVIMALSMAVVVSCKDSGDAGNTSASENSASEASNIVTVHFDLCTDLQTTNIKDKQVEKNSTINEPVVVVTGENPDNASVTGWYTDKSYAKQWNFETDKVSENITLYAKWSKSYKVIYHLPNEDADDPAYVTVTEGDKAPKKDTLADGYKLLGYYKDAKYTEKYDFDAPITANTEIYIKTSEELYLDAGSIDRNFNFIVTGGAEQIGYGKTLVKNGDEEYVSLNYGTRVNQGADSGLVGFIGNANVFIGKSQHLTMKIKNMGDATEFVVYANAMAKDTSWNGLGAAKYQYFFTDEQKNMTDDDEWITLEIRYDELTLAENGISSWATAVKVGDIRIDSYYWGEETEFKNVIQVKEIVGSYCEEYTTPADTVTPADDKADDLKAVSDKQSAVNGWIFPLDYAKATLGTGAGIYNTVEGLLAYVPYGETNGTFALGGKNIDVSDKAAALTLTYKNAGYGTKVVLNFELEGDKNVFITLNLPHNENFVTKSVFLADYKEFTGTLKSIKFDYYANGLNNLFTVAEVKIEKFEADDIAGLNFVSTDFAGFVKGEGYDLSFSSDEVATKIDVKTSGATMKKAYVYPTVVYSNWKLTAKTNGISKVKVAYTIGETVYTDELAFTDGNEYQTVMVPISGKGITKDVSLTFEGTGVIYLKELELKMNKADGVDFSNANWSEMAGKGYADWLGGSEIVYDESNRASVINHKGLMWLRNGYLKNVFGDEEYKATQMKAGKKLYVVYRNKTESAQMAMTLLVIKNDKDDYLHSPNFDTWKDGLTFNLKTNMADGEWAVAELEVSGNLGNGEEISEDWFISAFRIDSCPQGMEIRSIAYL